MADQWQFGKRKESSLAKGAEKAILVGLIRKSDDKNVVKEHIDELDFLASTAGAHAVKIFVQQLEHPNPRTFIGQGKTEEIADYIEEHDIDLVIFDDDLTAKQTSILEEIFKRKIIDRSSLILDIFAARARTAQAKTQVELAQMQVYGHT